VVQDLLARELVLEDSYQVYARGRLVLWVAEGGPPVAGLQDLLNEPVERVSMANPDHAPYGRAAREALTSSGIWEEVGPKLVMAENVKQALQFAQSGNVDVAFVALSLAITSEGKYELIPQDLHQPLDQALGIVAGSKHQTAARHFVRLLTGEEGGRILEKYGFYVPPAKGAAR
jgi:molybdate transport system substrate-binding protein